MAKHTACLSVDPKFPGVIKGPDNRQVGEAGLRGVDGNEDVRLANARLWAAAPKMLAALKRVDDLVAYVSAQMDGSDIYAEIVAAIAEAEGTGS